MKRFQVSKETDSLTLSMPMDYRQIAIGGLFFFIAVFCDAVLAALAVMDAQRFPLQHSSQALVFIGPYSNPFGFLWVVCSGLILVFIPFYALRMRSTGLTYSFDRSRGLLLCNDETLTPLDKVEHVRIRRLHDADGGHWYRLLVLYGDGLEIYIDESYEEDEVTELAYDIAEYACVPVVRK